MNWPLKFPRVWLLLLVGSLALLSPGRLSAQSFSDLKRTVDKAKSDADVIRLVKANSTAARQTDIASALKDLNDGQENATETADWLRTYVDLGAASEKHLSVSPISQQDAVAVKKDALYADPGFERQRNWLADALRRLKHLQPKESNQRTNVAGAGLFGVVFVYVAWALLIAAAGFVIFLAAKHLSWQGSLKRKAQALLEDSEPDRTVDEWLKLADDHAANGNYREAVRALYLACLLRFDEFDVARFVRTETNWEHLARIQSSAKLPEGFNFRPATQRFDRVWYGYQVKGLEDVALFRDWYTTLLARLKEHKP